MSVILDEGLWEKVYYELLSNVQLVSNNDERGDGTNKVFRTIKFQIKRKIESELKSVSQEVIDLLDTPSDQEATLPTLDNSIDFYEKSFAEIYNGMLVDMSKIMGKVQEDFEGAIDNKDNYKEVEGYNFTPSIRLNENLRAIKSTSEYLLNDGKESLSVYVEGYKIPHRYTYLYSDGVNTNVIVPRRYIDKIIKLKDLKLDEKGFLSSKRTLPDGSIVSKPYELTIYVEKKHFLDQNKFCSNFIIQNSETNEIFVQLKSGKTFEEVVNEDGSNIFVFVDGVYQVPGEEHDYKFIDDGDRVKIDFNDKTIVKMGSEIEIYIDGSISSSNIMSYTLENVAVGSKIPFFVQDTFYNPIFGPVDRDSCAFFVNGLRINNKFANQVGRLDFHVDFTNEVHDIIAFNSYLSGKLKPSILYQDDNKVNKIIGGNTTDNQRDWTTPVDRKVSDYKYKHVYGDDYFMYNFLGNNNEFPQVCKSLIGDGEGFNVDRKGIFEFDQYFGLHSSAPENYLDILSKPFNEGDFEWLHNTLMTSSATYKERIKMMLHRFPYLMKNFLEYFALQEDTYDKKCWNGTDSVVRIEVDKKEYQSGDRIVRVIYVNNVLVMVQDILYTGSETNFYVDIPTVLNINNPDYPVGWKPGCDNIITVYEISDHLKDNTIFRTAPIDRKILPNGRHEYRSDIATFGNIVTKSDFDLLEVTFKENDPNGLYFDKNEIGFKKVDKSRYTVEVENGRIHINFGIKDPLIHTLVVSRTRLMITDFLNKALHPNFGDPFVEIADFEDIFKRLYTGSIKIYWKNAFHDVKVPLTHAGKIVIYDKKSGRELYPDVDFVYKTPLSEPSLRESFIALFAFYELDMDPAKGNDGRISVNLLPTFNSGTETIMSVNDTEDPSKERLERQIFNWKTWYNTKIMLRDGTGYTEWTENKQYSKTAIVHYKGHLYRYVNQKSLFTTEEDFANRNIWVEMNSGIEDYMSRGLIYLSKLKFPYSTKYVNIYLNNLKVDDKDVAILSNKLVRISRKHKVSFQNLYVDYQFTVHYDDLVEFIELYKDSYFEKSVYKMFDGFDFFKAHDKTTTRETGLEYFLSFDPLMERARDEAYFKEYFDKRPNPIRAKNDDENDGEIDILTELYVRWFLSPDSNKLFSATEWIPERINRLLDIFRPADSDKRDVIIKSYNRNLTRNYVFATSSTVQKKKIDVGPDGVSRSFLNVLNKSIDPNNDVREYEAEYIGCYYWSSLKFFLQFCIDNNLTPNEAYQNYEKYKESNYLFKSDIVPIKAVMNTSPMEESDTDVYTIGRGNVSQIITNPTTGEIEVIRDENAV